MISILGSGLGPTACTKRLHLPQGNVSGNLKLWSKNTRMLLGKNGCANLSFECYSGGGSVQYQHRVPAFFGEQLLLGELIQTFRL